MPGSHGRAVTGADCYPFDGAEADGNILWSTAIFAGGKAVTTNNSTGLQVIHQPDGGAPVLSPEFDSIVGAGADSERIMNARLGIYLHALADRISHNVCTDTASMAGPSDHGWTESWTAGPCDQGYHVLLHAWETGVDFSQVPEANRTTINTLSAVYDELLSFAKLRSVAVPSTTHAEALLGDIATALETPDATARINALSAAACQHDLEPFPGAPACATEPADAASPAGAATTSSCSVGTGVGAAGVPFTAIAPWLVALGAMGIRRRQARARRAD